MGGASAKSRLSRKRCSTIHIGISSSRSSRCALCHLTNRFQILIEARRAPRRSVACRGSRAAPLARASCRRPHLPRQKVAKIRSSTASPTSTPRIATGADGAPRCRSTSAASSGAAASDVSARQRASGAARRAARAGAATRRSRLRRQLARAATLDLERQTLERAPSMPAAVEGRHVDGIAQRAGVRVRREIALGSTRSGAPGPPSRQHASDPERRCSRPARPASRSLSSIAADCAACPRPRSASRGAPKPGRIEQAHRDAGERDRRLDDVARRARHRQTRSRARVRAARSAARLAGVRRPDERDREPVVDDPPVACRSEPRVRLRSGARRRSRAPPRRRARRARRESRA